ncbi:acetyl-CoA carboxylase biotin carboxyl carrier protein [Asticcacaulis endophyticus]|uniref:Biotin carboxyl carrier protein of acetyl-CoA carboxylase n=1 Tax=Asticcacaulis endophyticus TaxID=1395890 RepID=A0A918QCH7_9CAUL|nr:acetyl-CoA carboxylase biotin carboxyl carrier protein [Asticcacaulis endophyticus]GGZ40172.1 acetyl-CoA carboxylase, biotin carboxyl carrier protein [Asticcacaulis endophyticus]
MSSPKGSSDPIDPRLVRKLADILKETDLSEIEVEQGELKIRVARQLTAAPAATYAVASAPVAAPAAPAAAPAAEAPKAAAKDVVSSPMVGTAYLSPQPGAPVFIKVGDRVKAGQTIMIVEAMKTMNPIPSPKDGVVAEILVADAAPVEFGAPLIAFE